MRPCCLALIKETIENHNLTFLEVCGPRSEEGVVIPMGYWPPRPFPFAKYRIGVVPSCFRNIDINALGLL